MRFQTISYPERAQLASVYTALLKAVPGLQSVPELGGSDGCSKLASAMLDIWEQISKRYTIDDAVSLIAGLDLSIAGTFD